MANDHKLDAEYSQMEDNDVWLVQMELERFIERNAPGMSGRLLYWLRALGAQARRANASARED